MGNCSVEEIGKVEADILLSGQVSQMTILNCDVHIQRQDTLYPLVFGRKSKLENCPLFKLG